MTILTLDEQLVKYLEVTEEEPSYYRYHMPKQYQRYNPKYQGLVEAIILVVGYAIPLTIFDWQYLVDNFLAFFLLTLTPIIILTLWWFTRSQRKFEREKQSAKMEAFGKAIVYRSERFAEEGIDEEAVLTYYESRRGEYPWWKDLSEDLREMAAVGNR